MKSSDRLFRALLRVLPAEFRSDYEREIAATFRAERRDAADTISLTRVWMATVADVFRTAPREHFDILRRDLAYAFRMLARRPALTITATLTLALGIGANTAIFSVVDGVLLAPLPYPDADRIVLVEEDEPDDEPGTTGYFSFDALRSENSSFDSMSAFAGWSAILAGDGKDAERVVGARVTWEYFRTLGVRPAIGRDFEQAEDHPQRRRVAFVSDSLWRRRFNADPSVVGKPVTINQVTYTLAGVMPAAFTELVTTRKFPDTEIWTVLGYAEQLPQACRTCRHIHVIGRLKAGVSVAQAEADLTRVYQSLSARFPTDYSQPRAVVTPVRDYFLGPVKSVLYLLWGAVGLLLLMACANIANLLLIRGSEREEEIAIRRALGVSPARMLRQLLTEAVVLAALGGIAGAVLAWWVTSVLTTYGPDAIPRLHEVGVNGRVLLYAAAVSLATGVLFGMAPARLLIARRDVESIVTRRSTAGPGAWHYRAVLITVNVALSATLLIGSGLLVRSFMQLLTVDSGFNPSGVLTMRIGSLPGVVGVSAATQLPLTENFDRSGITIEGRPIANPAESPEADRYAVRPGYFATLGIPLLRGRLLSDSDGLGAPPVVVIGKTMADALWPGQDPIGHRIRVAGGPGNPMRTIVGVVGDVRHYGLHLPPTLQVYVAHAQTHYPEAMMSVVVRMAPNQNPLAITAAIREHVRAIDPLQPVTAIRTYDAIVAESMATRRFTLVLLATFAGTALVLAVVGLYGALSYVVTQRHREIGVRVALGAEARDISRLVVRQGMGPAVAGLFVGLLVSAGAGRLVDAMLYGVSSRDVVTFVTVFALISAAALIACLIPARSAAGISPSVALRAE
jgi:putative ABC transport system permease protein